MPQSAFTLVLAALAAAAVWSGTAHSQESGAPAWEVTLDNDKWASGTDRHYTHGTRITRRSADVPRWLRRAAGGFACMACTAASAVAFQAGQEIYTPEETWRTDLVAHDRPYAGWSYVAATLFAERSTARERRTAFNVVGLQVGIVGPASLAERTQELIHDRKSVRRPRGWDHQLANEPGVLATFERGFVRAVGRTRRVDVAPYFAAAGGNVLAYAGGGVRLRAGSDLGFGPVATRGWRVFLDVEARAVARNIFLDGNTLTDSHSVAKERLVAVAGAGVEYGGERVRLAVAAEARSPEFVGQRSPDRFTSLTFSLR